MLQAAGFMEFPLDVESWHVHLKRTIPPQGGYLLGDFARVVLPEAPGGTGHFVNARSPPHARVFCTTMACLLRERRWNDVCRWVSACLLHCIGKSGCFSKQVQYGLFLRSFSGSACLCACVFDRVLFTGNALELNGGSQHLKCLGSRRPLLIGLCKVRMQGVQGRSAQATLQPSVSGIQVDPKFGISSASGVITQC